MSEKIENRLAKIIVFFVLWVAFTTFLWMVGTFITWNYEWLTLKSVSNWSDFDRAMLFLGYLIYTIWSLRMIEKHSVKSLDEE